MLIWHPIIVYAAEIRQNEFNVWGSGKLFKNAYEFLNLRAVKFSTLYEIIISQCMDTIFCVEFQR